MMQNLEQERLQVAVKAFKSFDFGMEVEKNSFWNETGHIWSTIVYLNHLSSNPEYAGEVVTFFVEFAPNSSMFLDCYANTRAGQSFGMLKMNMPEVEIPV